MAVDKKVQDGRLRLILLRDLGLGVIVDAVDTGEVRETLAARRTGFASAALNPGLSLSVIPA